MGNRKKDKYIDRIGRQVVGANVKAEMDRVFKDSSDKFRALEKAAKRLGNGTGPSRSTIQRLTIGENGVSIDHLFLLARALEVDAYRLFLADEQKTHVVDVREVQEMVARKGTKSPDSKGETRKRAAG